jgi:hypothetical protein
LNAVERVAHSIWTGNGLCRNYVMWTLPQD